MVIIVVRLAALLSLGLVAGGALCIFLIERSFSGDAAFYTQYKQLVIRALTLPLPALAGIALLANAYDCFWLYRRSAMGLLGLSASALLLNVGAMALTRSGHFPLNAEILGWSSAHPPADWSLTQGKWWSLHIARTLTSVAAFTLLLLSSLWSAQR